jgi:phosphoribosylamine--glycine ligase
MGSRIIGPNITIKILNTRRFQNMKVLLVGKWGKAHAMAEALVKNNSTELYSIMDRKNKGIARLAKDYKLGDVREKYRILKYAQSKNIDLAVISPEMALNEGVTDLLEIKGIPSVGPSRMCSKLESDKAFTRNLLKENKIDVSPHFEVFDSSSLAMEYIKQIDHDFAIKPSGVTEGDGVKVMGIQLKSKKQAIKYVKKIFDENMGGLPSVVIEDKMEGEEFTLQAFVDGKNVIGMPAVRDYKLLYMGEKGPNTPGMGSYSDSNHLLPFLSSEAYAEGLFIMKQVVKLMRDKFGEEYKGILSGQFIITKDGLKLIEFNIRPGDSEILNLIPILKSDFVEICKAIYEQKLDQINIVFDNKATVCKYVVPLGFPYPQENMEVRVDEEAITGKGGHLFYSCSEMGENLYRPSPRGFGVTGVADSIYEAEKVCESCIKSIHGEDLFHRRDIGTPALTEAYK